MAKRRMFSSAIVLSDVFLDMPASARCLYFTFGMTADDDGFVNNPRSVMRQIGATEEDLQTLLRLRYILGFDSGVICVKHWRINNYIRSDRYSETTYREEKATLTLDAKGAYTEKDKGGIPVVYQETEDGIPNMGRPSIDKDSVDKDIWHPALGDIELFCQKEGLTVSPYAFWKTFEERNWMQDGEPVRNWKAMLKAWDRAKRTVSGKPDEIVMAVLKQMEEEDGKTD